MPKEILVRFHATGTAAGRLRDELKVTMLAPDALEWVDQLSADMRDTSSPPEDRQLGRTMRRWQTQIAAWHEGQVSNGPTETMNGLAKRIKRVAFGMTNLVHWRIRVLLYAGRPDWTKLATVTP